MNTAPRSFNRHIYDNHPENVFYGTDDGRQDGSFGEFALYQDHYDSVPETRRENIHMISVVGGLYGLNFIPLWRPTQLTIFDINPMAITYFKAIHKVFITSNDAAHFLDRLTNSDYEAESEEDLFVQENIAMQRRRELPRERGSTKRSFEDSWKIALENFDLTKQILRDAPMTIRSEPMESESFSTWIRDQGNTWIYASNITEFHFFDLEFNKPENVVLAQIVFPGKEELLDLSSFSGGPVRAHFAIPLTAERI